MPSWHTFGTHDLAPNLAPILATVGDVRSLHRDRGGVLTPRAQSENTDVVHVRRSSTTTASAQFIIILQIPVAERMPQIPPHAEKDHDILEVSTTEQYRPRLGHRLTVADRRIPFATQPSRGS